MADAFDDAKELVGSTLTNVPLLFHLAGALAPQYIPMGKNGMTIPTPSIPVKTARLSV